MRLIVVLLLLLPLSGCASGGPKLPYPTWYIGLGAPRYMEARVESVDVVDRRNLAFEGVHGGVVAYNNRTEGWWEGGGKMMPINNVDLPNIIFVRWQSLVEPQVYKLRIDIPEWVREEMLAPRTEYCSVTKQVDTSYRKMISIGLAPGGIVKVWVGGACLPFKEVGRFVGVVEPRGTHKGYRGGHFTLKPSEAARTYIEAHGIPYDSW
ncbi:DUF2931 family protein [Pseudomonas otitidis]|nr:DUF2931 family protein [Pseudomonas otitidis]MBO2930522.1 DUF2931 family protein [Pseudomonas otitidis]